MSTSDERIESVAKALADHSYSEACKAIDSLEFDCRDIEDLIEKASKESDTAKIIIFSSYIEEKTVDLFKLHMRNLSKAQYNSIFGPNGPLSTFSARINLAYSLYWITEKTYQNLNKTRKLRNLFAHNAYKIDISTPEAKDLIDSIDVDIDKVVGIADKIMEQEGYRRISTEISPPERLILKQIAVARSTFLEMLAGPISLRHHVSPARLINAELDSGPATFREIEKYAVDALLTVVGYEEVQH